MQRQMKVLATTSSFLPPIQNNSAIKGERRTVVKSDANRMSTIMITNAITREEKKVELDFKRNRSKRKATKVLKLSTASAYGQLVKKPSQNTESSKREGDTTTGSILLTTVPSPEKSPLALPPSTSIGELKKKWKAIDKKKRKQKKKKTKVDDVSLDDSSSMHLLSPEGEGGSGRTKKGPKKKLKSSPNYDSSVKKRIEELMGHAEEQEKKSIERGELSKASPIRISKETSRSIRKNIMNSVGSGFWQDHVCSPLAAELDSLCSVANGASFRLRREVIIASIRIKDWWVMIRTRRHEMATRISAFGRGFLVRKELYEKALRGYSACILIQGFFRKLLRKLFKLKTKKAIKIQCAWRCAAARKRLQKNHYRLHCTVKAQRLWRVYCRVKHCRNAYMFVCHRLVRKRVAAVKIQKFWRLHHHFKKYMSSTIRIQSFFRGVKGKIKLYARRSRALGAEKLRYADELAFVEVRRRRRERLTLQDFKSNRATKKELKVFQKKCKLLARQKRKKLKNLRIREKVPQYLTEIIKVKNTFTTIDTEELGYVRNTYLPALLRAFGIPQTRKKLHGMLALLGATGNIHFPDFYDWVIEENKKKSFAKFKWQLGLTFRAHITGSLYYQQAKHALMQQRLREQRQKSLAEFRKYSAPNFECPHCLKGFALYKSQWAHIRCAHNQDAAYTNFAKLVLKIAAKIEVQRAIDPKKNDD